MNIYFLIGMSNESIRLNDSMLGFTSDDFYWMYCMGGEL